MPIRIRSDRESNTRAKGHRECESRTLTIRTLRLRINLAVMKSNASVVLPYHVAKKWVWTLLPAAMFIKLLIVSVVWHVDLHGVGTIYDRCLWENHMIFVGSNWNFFSEYLKNDDTYFVICQPRITRYKEMIDLKGMFQTYAKRTVN